MLKPVRMCRLECAVARDRTDAVVGRLHILGISQVDFLSEDDLQLQGIARERLPARSAEASGLAERAKKLFESLETHGQTRTGMLDLILQTRRIEPRHVEEAGYETLKQEADAILTRLEGSAGACMRRLKGLSEERTRLQERIGRLEAAKGLDVPQSLLGESRYLRTVAGTIEADSSGELGKKLAEAFGDAFAVSILSPSKYRSVIAVTSLKGAAAAADQLLRSVGFEDIRPEGTATFRVEYEAAQARMGQIAILESQEEGKLGRLHAESSLDIEILLERLRIEEERCRVFGRFGSTTAVSYMRLWAPKTEAKGIIRAVEEESAGECAIAVDWEPGDAPSLLGNPPAFKPFELLTRMFSTPKYNQIDPTAVTAPTFVLFTGFMIGDVCYGLLLLAVGLYVRREYGRYSKTIDDAMVMLLWCSLSTIAFGAMFGSYFGDFLANYVLRIRPSQLPLAIMDPMEGQNTIILFAIVMATGVLHTVFGNVLGIFDKLRRGEVKAALKENASSLIFLAGAGLAFSGKANAGIALLALGFAMFWWNLGFMAIMQVPGILGNIVSYVRLLALNLTTPGLALAFNLLASMAWGVPVIGPILAAAIFAASHLLVLFLSAIGPFVHAMRLHFVEFYSTFYPGGGTDFAPFAQQRRYTTIRR
jgi:V/A-type H+/Na+-transporting ATPase subunit I